MNNIPKKGHGFIYKYTSPSGKSYIGQTVKSLQKRAGHNGKNYQRCKVFYKAIQKYGFDNFEVEILCEIPVEKLNEIERKYIEVYNTLIPNGYNILENYAPNNKKKVYCYDLDGNLKNVFNSITEASEKTQTDVSSISACLNKNQRIANHLYWSFLELKKYPISEAISNDEKKIQMFDLNNVFLIEFKSIADAAKYVNGERSAIKKACRNEIKSAYGYHWQCSEILKEKKYNNTPKQILKLDINSLKIIQSYPSISAAARSVGATGTSLIRRVLDKPQYAAYGYKWMTAQGSTTKCL